jgi:hypothetical protein
MGTRILTGIALLAAALTAAADESRPAPAVMEEVVVTAKYPDSYAQALAELRAALHDRLLDETQRERLRAVKSRDEARGDETG